MTKYIVVLFLFVFSVPANAYSQIDKISEIKVTNGNKTLIKFQNATWHGCGGSSQTNPNPFFLISEGDNISDQRKGMLSIALAAMMSGKPVWIKTGGSGGDTPGCSSSGYEWLYQLSIYPN